MEDSKISGEDGERLDLIMGINGVVDGSRLQDWLMELYKRRYGEDFYEHY